MQTFSTKVFPVKAFLIEILFGAMLIYYNGWCRTDQQSSKRYSCDILPVGGLMLSRRKNKLILVSARWFSTKILWTHCSCRLYKVTFSVWLRFKICKYIILRLSHHMHNNPFLRLLGSLVVIHPCKCIVFVLNIVVFNLFSIVYYDIFKEDKMIHSSLQMAPKKLLMNYTQHSFVYYYI